MKLDKKRRLAADILGVGANRVWVDPERSVDISSAITREDIKGLIKQGVISVKPEIGISRGRHRARELKRKVGRRRGPGTRKGASGARTPKKANWIKTVRPLRAKLKQLRKDGVVGPGEYRRLYLMIKGGSFRSKAHLEAHLREKGVMK